MAATAAAARVLVIACGALAREIAAVTASLPHIHLQCLPATLHNRPERIAPAVQTAIRAARADYGRIFVAYAECGTGGALDAVLAEEGVGRLAGPHCYAFYSGLDRFMAAGDADMRSFFLTDFLARQFQALVIEPLGLDRFPDLRDSYFGAYARVVYLAQTDDPVLDRAARAAAGRLGLEYERRFTGYGDLPAALENL
jgi:hypothetical protein